MIDRLLFIVAALTVVGVAVELARRGGVSVPGMGGTVSWDEEPDQLPGLLDAAVITMTPSTYTPSNVDADTAQSNRAAFLAMIRYAEGTDGPRGYETMFGYRYFDSYADHPRQYFPFTDGAGRQLKSSAAGAYQIIVKTWDTLRARLGLPDFSPASQDAAALELIRERGALADVDAGRFADAVRKVSKVWASLPGAGYAQPERALSSLYAAYRSAGGTVNEA
ncbi:glycoside hydrolase family 24 protein [Pseudarthrobacter oxydans]|uniref:glycoside hydrolase family 24 protein n=1 Tax=Pseudarthrobacter oxydans TaxID=1671 RepID=UPI003418FDCD